MLTKFTVENFKTIKNVTIDFASAPPNDGYDFNTEAVKNGIVTKAMLYGKTGVGKSTLCEALLNITTHIYKDALPLNIENPYEVYSFDKNAPQHYVYEFKFGEKAVKYDYTKTTRGYIDKESLYVDDRLVVSHAPTYTAYPVKEDNETLHVNINGAEGVDWGEKMGSKHEYSLVWAVLEPELNNAEGSYISNDPDRETLKAFCDFVCRMRRVRADAIPVFDELWYSDEQSPSLAIVRRNRTTEFNDFLKVCGFGGYSTEINSWRDDDGGAFSELLLTTPYSDTPGKFDEIASAGLKELALCYSTYIETALFGSFLVIDDFGNNLSHKVARETIKLFKKLTDRQILLIGNNTDLISNDLLRPDCYFNMTEKKGNVTIKSFRKSTHKDIRFENNLQKMYKADFFE